MPKHQGEMKVCKCRFLTGSVLGFWLQKYTEHLQYRGEKGPCYRTGYRVICTSVQCIVRSEIDKVGPIFHQLICYVINRIHTLIVAKRGLFLWRKSSGMNGRIPSMTSKP